jgi:hypothetical protein
MSNADLERELLPFQNSFPEELSDEQLARICTIHRLLSRTTAGPARKTAAQQIRTMTADDIANMF